MKKKMNLTSQYQASYQKWREKLRSNPNFQAIYEEEAAKSELWLQLVEARHASGFTQAKVAQKLDVSQAQVARIEKQGYDAYTLNTLRRYVQALGDEFSLEVSIRKGGYQLRSNQTPATL